MRTTIDRLDFLRALANVRCLSEGGVTVTIKDGKAFIVTSNKEKQCYGDPALQVKSRFTVREIQGDGDLIFTFNARKLAAIAKNLSGEQFVISLNNKKAVIEGSGARFDLDLYKENISPSWPDIPNFRKVSSSSLSFLIDKTIYALTGKDDSYHFYESCLFLDHGEEYGRVRMVATNGHLLAMSEVLDEALSVDLPSDGLLLPYRGVKALSRLVSSYEGEEEEPEYGFTDSMLEMRFSYGESETVLSMGFVDRKYPDYRNVLSSATDNDSVMCFSSDVLSALRRIAIISDSVCFTGGHGDIELSSALSSVGEEAFEKIIGEYSPNGGDLSVRFNGKYITGILESAFADSEKVEVFLKDYKSSVLVKGKGTDDFHNMALIMPIIVNS